MTDATPPDLIVVVQTHYADPKAGPLWLSRLGQLLGDGRAALVEQSGSLAEAVRAVGPDKLDLISEVGNIGRVAVVTPAARDRVEKQLSGQATGESAAFNALPTPLQIAFCLRTEPGEVVAVKTSAPVRYEKLAQGVQPPTGLLIIEERYRSPGVMLQTATKEDLERLWRNFLAWADHKGLDADLIQKRQKPANALERLMAAQSADVVERLNLPGDIVALLLRHA
ncbi:MAG: hypothetical protein EON90_09160 [Brevundimonas sp.]|nr:MAG: hypothetical protein EON90_09160 [Brevundimonas sp.]